jgi:hypothetical protein
MIYGFEIVLLGLIVFVITSMAAVFSPLGIFFTIFSIIRAKTSSNNLRTVSLVFQIILCSLTFLIGFFISLAILLSGYNYRIGSEQLIASISIIVGALFIVAIEVGVLIWESLWIRGKE